MTTRKLPDSFRTDGQPPAKRRCADDSREHAVFLVENGLALVDSPRRITFTTSTEPAILRREPSLGTLSYAVVMLKILVIGFWNLLVEIVNRNLTAKKTLLTHGENTRRNMNCSAGMG